ncbi:hypothetical protein ABFV47_07370 [Mycolicibacterium fortuitum]|uniref:hypothetical protein n=1 Tax=Mycolicibacterium TaxID=1866885 RepID=UPI003204AEF0
MKLKTALLVPAVVSIALSAAVTAAVADPGSDYSESETSDVRVTPATVTVTATVAPGQCAPVAGGPPNVAVTDTAVEPQPSEVRDASITATMAANGEVGPSGVSTSRFDPYTCAPVPAAVTSNAAPVTPEQPDAQVPTYTAPLAPYPGSHSSGVAGGADTEATSTQGPLSPPTASSTLPAAPEPR